MDFDDQPMCRKFTAAYLNYWKLKATKMRQKPSTGHPTNGGKLVRKRKARAHAWSEDAL
jgi:hypothetical protein